ncbi:DNA-directed RNA polymerase III subunit RPC4 [Manduca sexta]|uniref:DNA-directed RNA polymerase III subunit RPC4 n=1 Tax=Manduca sexta TaxID=7130 RepID=A0A921Z4S2_MANSE|nr:DNA-directed RNA polymerase III subunit RPC4 [Manduca sexta]KAG6451306.1 hypothetical protein O3G_MSEX007061 [Manduca sexta]
MSEEKNPKSNGLGGDPMQRLASLKGPRDLMLGAGKASKKVFVPNLNVARNKNKGPSTANAREQKKDERGRRDRKDDRNKNFRNGSNIIKSSGVFSEGLGAGSRRHIERGSYSRDSDPSPVLQKPTIRVKDVIKIDKELEEQKIRSVMGESSNGVDEDSLDFKEVLDKDAPIKLPMDDGNWSTTTAKPKVKVKQEVIVKREPGDDVDCAITHVEEKPDVKEMFENTDVVNLLRTDKSTLILLQLPDSLPGRGGSVDDDAPRRKANNDPSTSASTGETEEKQPDNRCRLADLEEGRIGKLLVHRSGRVSLALGDTIFEVSMGTKASFHQEAVSMGVNEGSRSANLVSLGPLHHKLNILPDWETMFRDMPI